MLIYAAVAAVGFLFLMIMLFVGELFGADHDVAAHDMVTAEGGADYDAGPSLFSARVIASFLTAFGVGGIVGRYYNLSHPAASGIGVVSGVVLAGVVYQFAKLLYTQQASSEVHMTGLVGRPAEVTVAIPAGGVGKVALTYRGEHTEHIARSKTGQAMVRGAEVVITGLGGDAVVVSPGGTQARGGGT